VWAYDALDFVAAKNGQKDAWDVTPYASWDFSPVFTAPAKTAGGVAFDPATGRIYISEVGVGGSKPVISVYQVTTTAAASRSIGTTSDVSTSQSTLGETAPILAASELISLEAPSTAPTVSEATSTDSRATAPVSMAAKSDILRRFAVRGSAWTNRATNQAVKPTSWFGSTLGD